MALEIPETVDFGKLKETAKKRVTNMEANSQHVMNQLKTLISDCISKKETVIIRSSLKIDTDLLKKYKNCEEEIPEELRGFFIEMTVDDSTPKYGLISDIINMRVPGSQHTYSEAILKETGVLIWKSTFTPREHDGPSGPKVLTIRICRPQYILNCMGMIISEFGERQGTIASAEKYEPIIFQRIMDGLKGGLESLSESDFMFFIRAYHGANGCLGMSKVLDPKGPYNKTTKKYEETMFKVWNEEKKKFCSIYQEIQEFLSISGRRLSVFVPKPGMKTTRTFIKIKFERDMHPRRTKTSTRTHVDADITRPSPSLVPGGVPSAPKGVWNFGSDEVETAEMS